MSELSDNVAKAFRLCVHIEKYCREVIELREKNLKVSNHPFDRGYDLGRLHEARAILTLLAGEDYPFPFTPTEPDSPALN